MSDEIKDWDVVAWDDPRLASWGFHETAESVWPTPVVEWRVLEGKHITVKLPYGPPWWRRLLCRVVLGSTFRKL